MKGYLWVSAVMRKGKLARCHLCLQHMWEHRGRSGRHKFQCGPWPGEDCPGYKKKRKRRMQ